MNNCFIILAAGKSKRFNSKIPKQYHLYNGKSLIQHSVDKIKKYKRINKILLVINKTHKKFIKKNSEKGVTVIFGGKTRAESSFKALKYLKKYNLKNVLIHDAARPNFSIKLVENIINKLKQNNCVIPVTQTQDSVKFKDKNKIINVKRENVYFSQTPQGFRYKELLKLQNDTSSKITDDANLFISASKKIKIIKGELDNKKITINSDIKNNNLIRYGIGFDVHRLVPKKKLFLGGIKIPSSIGTLGHSDGDTVLHAIIDALLGACKMGDIGENFSDNDKKFKNIRSTILLGKIIKKMQFKNFIINNIDINIIAQKPKIQKFKNKMINCITKLCKISPSQINIKGKTTEKLGLIGREKAIACEVVASIIKNV